MSFSENEHIDDLFKKLQDENLEADIMQMNDMEIRLEKMRFYKFGWKHFNIYHTGMICLCFTFSLWTFIAHLTESNVLVAAQKISTTSDKRVEERPFEKTKAVSSNSLSSKKKKNVVEMSKEISPVVIDSSAYKTVVTNPVILEPKKVDSIIIPRMTKPRKKVYVSQRDTIIQYDTTRVIKKK